MSQRTASSFVDQVRALVNERAGLMARRIEIDSRLSLLDADLNELRQLLDLGPRLVSPSPAAATEELTEVRNDYVETLRELESTIEAEPPPPAKPTVGAVDPESRIPNPDPPARGVAGGDRRAEVLALLDRGPLATREVAEQLGVDRLVCKMTLQRMKKVGLITSVGVTNGQRWALTAASRTAAPRTAPPPTAPPPDPSREDAAPVEARDAAILQRITSNNGVATIQELRRWFYSKADINGGGNSEAYKDDALHNALLRLKAKGILARTADVWSEVGRGAMRA